MMTVRELIEALAHLPDWDLVVFYHDSEAGRLPITDVGVRTLPNWNECLGGNRAVQLSN